ncbi:MAG: potassium channel family protein, partial [Candidatus Kapaibacterium sp.]
MIRAFPTIGRFVGRHLSEPLRRFQIALMLLLLLVVTGTTGFRVIEGMGFVDSLYMTLITITTVGFGEVHPLSQEGRIFTMVLIVMGVGTAAWALGTGIEVVLGENLWQSVQRRRLMKDTMNLSNHYIVCGYGRMGRQIVNDLKNRGEDFVVIELSGQTEERLLEKGYPYVIGDAEDNNVLIRAGIERARGLVTALDTDAANVLTVLSARELRADLLIVARATN